MITMNRNAVMRQMSSIYRAVISLRVTALTGRVVFSVNSLSLLIMLLFCLNLAAVTYLSVDWGNVADPVRATELFYHNNNVDQLWYGTDKWAVKFDIQSYTTAADTLTLQNVKAYFPYSGGSYSLKIYTDDFQPLEALALQKNDLQVNQGWNEIVLQEAEYITGSVFWIVIEYETNDRDRFIAASAVGGANSYYWVPEDNGIRGHFANMEQNSISAELLITVGGELDIEGYDMELLSFSLGGNVNKEGTVYPKVVIRNNSSVQIDTRLTLSIELTNPTVDNISFRATALETSLAAGESRELSFDRSTATLSETSAEYRIRATLNFEDDGFPDNNRALYYFDTLPKIVSANLIENFVRTNHAPSNSIISEQEDQAGLNAYIINYFFDAADIPHYSIESAIRRDYYGLYGYPFTLVNGVESIGGHSDSYSDNLLEKINKTKNAATFIRVAFNPRTDYLEIDTEEMLLSMGFNIINRTSYPLQSTIDNLRMFVALTEKNVTGYPGNNLIHLYRVPGNLDIGLNGNHRFEWELPVQTVQTIERELTPENLPNFEIIYWIQHLQTKKIYHIDSFRLSDFDLNIEEDAVPQPAAISVHPNPFTGRENVTIKLTGNDNAATILTEAAVYNIKGQLVGKLDAFNENTVHWDGKMNDGANAPTGLYFLKIETAEQTNNGLQPQPAQYKRMSIIRSK